LVAGEPGIGKTRLAVQLAILVHDEGGLVLAGRCDEDLGVPYQPFVEALRHYAAHVAEPRLGRHGGELVRLVPELAEGVPGLPPPLRSDPETERYRLFDAVAAWLADVCAEAPVLFVLDDLHWAARPTLLLLRHVVSFHEPLRLLVLGTYRDSEVGRGHPLSELLADLRRVEGVERFPLTGLDQTGVAAFIEAAAGHRLGEEDEALPRTVWAETQGNPFFVAEVLRHLTETGLVEYRAGRWITTAPIENLGIPEGVRDVVGRRLSRLSEAANRALGVASVAGLEFEPGVVRFAGGFEEDALLRALEEAAGARLLSEIPGATVRYRFFHALVRATLYDELSAARRVVFHRKVAEAIETVHAGRLDDHLSALAHHWTRAAAPVAETARAVDYARRAGDVALAQLAQDEAVGYYRQALELLEASDGGAREASRLELLIVLGEAQRRAGDPAFRHTLLEATRLAQRRGDAAGLTRAVLANSRGMMHSAVTHVDRERVAALEAAISAGPVADSPERARLLATLGLELTSSGERQRRIALSDEALAMARRLDDDATLAHVLIARFYSLVSPDTLATRLADTAELVAIAERLGDPVVVAYVHFVRARAQTEHGDVEAARADLDVAEGIAADLGQPTLRWYTAWGRAAHLTLSGHLEEAEAVAREAGRLAEATSQPDGPVYLAYQLFAIRAEQDRLVELESVLAGFVERFPEAAFSRAMLALLLSELGRNREAKELLEHLDFLLVPVNLLWLWTMTTLSVVAARLHDVERCTALHQLIAPYPDQITGVGVLWRGSVSHYLGLLATTLGSFDGAEDHFSAAAATHERISAPIWLARTRLEWARMLLARKDRGDAQRARALLDQAITTARALGLANVQRRAGELLNRL
jgi:tetratricopeptide (TPR) repeat protein